ncbi:hypothetical protein [Marinactinospora rubrisoli]|uniref:Uncharacterized protein n=1 Tax=Marinactinospora rubrisoli TaxID=2715399 RepID=A0ABW2KM37_9ACTN
MWSKKIGNDGGETLDALAGLPALADEVVRGIDISFVSSVLEPRLRRLGGRVVLLSLPGAAPRGGAEFAIAVDGPVHLPQCGTPGLPRRGECIAVRR